MQVSGVSGDVTGGANVTILSVMSTASRRPRLLAFSIGCSGAAADNVAKLAFRYLTTDNGTRTTGTGICLDGSLSSPSCVTRYNYTVEPTYAAGNLWEIPLNQRATQVITVPSSILMMPNIGTANGLGLQMLAGPALAYNVTFFWDE